MRTKALCRLVFVITDVVWKTERVRDFKGAVQVKTEEHAVRIGTLRLPSMLNDFGDYLGNLLFNFADML